MMDNKLVYGAQVNGFRSLSGDEYYSERTDRNLGWITAQEQDFLRKSVIGVAGCGGMGGLLASTFVRLGIGEVRIADSEDFDISNLNRQFAANSLSIGKSKVIETAKMLRNISKDVKIVVYTKGIIQENVSEFVDGCDFICDEIEFWAAGARILLHQAARECDIPILTCSSVGFGTRLFLFNHQGMSVEDMHRMSLIQAMTLQEKVQNRSASSQEVRFLMNAVLNALIPELAKYSRLDAEYDDKKVCISRLLNEQRAPIIATNPPLASGFAANHTLLYMLAGSGFRKVVAPPLTPGYLYFDSALMDAKSVNRLEVADEEQ